MVRQKSEEKRRWPLALSRRTFMQLGIGSLAAWLAGCGASLDTEGDIQDMADKGTEPPAPTHAPTFTSEPTATLPPTETEVSASTPLPPTYTPVPATPSSVPATDTPVSAAPMDRATLMAHWPAAESSRVILVRHAGVWQGDQPDPAVVMQMLDEGLRTLSGVTDVMSVWRTLFAPTDRVLLKVNCIAYNGPTQPAVTYAVAQRLQDAGLPAENILIFDRTDNELAAAGYTLNEGGAGVQCYGARGQGTEAVLSQASVRFYQAFDTYDAIINLPTPKQHGTAGISVSMKNHYGSINRPGALHGSRCDPAIAELNAHPNVRDKTRLIVGTALNVSPCDWNSPERENALLLSFDPVALDTVARDILVRHREELGLNAGFLIDGAPQLATAQSMGLGATDASLIDLREVVLA